MNYEVLWKLADYQIMVSLLIVIVAWKWGDWKNWKAYYPTMLYFIIGDFTYSLITNNHPLWEYESPLLKTTLSDLLIAFVFFPSTVLLFLPYFPRKIFWQAIYVFIWVFIYTIVEYVSYNLGYFSYHNGWNIWWSGLVSFIMFPALYLHYKNPLWAWLLGLISCIAVVIIFKVPFSSMK